MKVRSLALKGFLEKQLLAVSITIRLLVICRMRLLNESLTAQAFRVNLKKIAFRHRRLAILELSETGRHSMTAEFKQYVIT